MNTIWVDLLGTQTRYYGQQFRTRVIDAGDGEPLLLIHGVGGHAEAYSRNVARLGQQCRAMAIDLVWHGCSSKPPHDGQTLPTIAAQLIDLLDSLGIERTHLEGESLGGWVGIWFAIHHPERLNKLILNTSVGVRYAPGTIEERPHEGRELLKQRSMEAINHPTRETVRKRLEWLMAEPDRVTDELVDLRYRLYTEPETRRALTDVFTRTFDTDIQFQFQEADLQGVKAPTLVFWTDRNPGTGPDVGQRLASLIPGAQFYCMADAAHWPQWEHPEEHDDVVLRFLRGESVS
jgi:pimeloyl-ACP methyl ester carboxylesterase